MSNILVSTVCTVTLIGPHNNIHNLRSQVIFRCHFCGVEQIQCEVIRIKAMRKTFKGVILNMEAEPKTLICHFSSQTNKNHYSLLGDAVA